MPATFVGCSSKNKFDLLTVDCANFNITSLSASAKKHRSNACAWPDID